MDHVLVERPAPGVAQVTLNLPERMNSMSFDVMVPLRERLRELSDDNEVRAVVLTGAGRGFCSGADQSGERGRTPNTAGLTQATVALRAMEILDDVVLALRGLHQPFIGAHEEATRADSRSTDGHVGNHAGVGRHCAAVELD